GDVSAIVGEPIVIGGDGVDTMNVDDSNSLAINAPNYTVTPNAVFNDEGFGGVSFDATLDKLNVTGDSRANEFDVSPNLKTVVQVNGNDPTTLPGDSLVVDFSGVTGRNSSSRSERRQGAGLLAAVRSQFCSPALKVCNPLMRWPD